MTAHLIVSEGSPAGVLVDAPRNQRRFGVPVGGAFHPTLAELANLIVGNDSHAPVVELDRRGTQIVSNAPISLGATQPDGSTRLVFLESGETLRCGPFSHGVGYLAVLGGMRATEGGWEVLDSRSAQPRAREITLAAPTFQADLEVRILPGPRADLGFHELTSRPFHFDRQIDRIGLRLEEALAPHAEDPPSEPTCPGAIQIPPDGRPIILGPDGPTIGGYPVAGYVLSADLETLSQAIPGRKIQFLDVTELDWAGLRLSTEEHRRRFMRRVRLGLQAQLSEI